MANTDPYLCPACLLAVNAPRVIREVNRFGVKGVNSVQFTETGMSVIVKGLAVLFLPA